jgi:hypothetical protein
MIEDMEDRKDKGLEPVPEISKEQDPSKDGTAMGILYGDYDDKHGDK